MKNNASQALMCERKAFPKPWPSDAPLTNPSQKNKIAIENKSKTTLNHIEEKMRRKNEKKKWKEKMKRKNEKKNSDDEMTENTTKSRTNKE